MTAEEHPASDRDLIYEVFRPVKELGRGGQARVLKVRADRESEGFSAFLASAIAWHEVNKHKQIAPLRLKIATINRNIQTLLSDEAVVMDRGDEDQAGTIRANIQSLQNALLAEVDTLKKRQSEYVQKRSSNITEADPDKMIRHMAKIGLPYPDDDIFAMKMVLLDDDESLKSRLQDEFKSLKLLEHPNILKVFACGEGYYIEEYISGIVESDEIIPDPDRSKERFTNGQRLGYVVEAAKALEHTHLFGVIHRDVKPDNIAVGDDGRVRLIDFGVAKSAESEVVTQTGMAVGTPSFMSPGQIQSPREVNPSFDVYSLGAALYNYVTGKLPYYRSRNRFTGREKEPQSAQDVMISVADKNVEPIPPSEIAPGTPRVLELIIQKAMEKEQQRRYQSVTEFREDLERFIEKAGFGMLNSSSFFTIEPVEVDMTIRRRGVRSSRPRRETPKNQKIKNAGIAAGVLAVLIIVLIAFSGKPEETGLEEKSSIPKEASANIREMYEYAEQYEKNHPGDLPAMIRHYESVKERSNGTVYQMKCTDKLKKLRDDLQKGKKQVLSGLQKEADALIADDDYPGAINLYKQYNSEFAGETASERRQKTAEIEQKWNAFKNESARLEMERRQKEAEKKRQKERELREAELKREQEIAQLRNSELPLLRKQVVDALKSREYRDVQQSIRGKLGDSKYESVREDLLGLDSVLRTGQSFVYKIGNYFNTQKGKNVSIKKTDGSVESGISKGVKDRKVSLAKKMIVDGASLETVLKIPLEEIDLTFLVHISAVNISDPDVAFNAYIEAELRKDQGAMEQYRPGAEKHPLFKYLVPDKTEVQAEEPVTTAEKPASESSFFKISPSGRIQLNNADFGFVHYGEDNPTKTIPQSGNSIQIDPGYPKKSDKAWEGKGTFVVGGGEFNYHQKVKYDSSQAISYSIELRNDPGIQTTYMFVSVTIPKEFGRGKQLIVDNRKYTIADDFNLPFGVRRRAEKFRIPVEGGALEISGMTKGIYFSTLSDVYLMQVHFERTPEKGIMTSGRINLNAVFIPDEQPAAEEEKKDDTGWIDILKGNTFEETGWNKADRVKNMTYENGILTKGEQDTTCSFYREIQFKGDTEIEVEFKFVPGEDESHRWITFAVWPDDHWKDGGTCSVQYSGWLPGRHTMNLFLKGQTLSASLDGEKYNSRFTNRLTRPIRGGGQVRLYVPAQAVLSLLSVRYRPLSETGQTGNDDEGAGWVDMLKGASFASAGWLSDTTGEGTLHDGVLTKTAQEKTGTIYKRIQQSGDNLEVTIEFEYVYRGEARDWLHFGLWAFEHWKGNGTFSVPFPLKSSGRHEVKLVTRGLHGSAWVDGKVYPQTKNSLKKSMKDWCEFRIGIPAGVKLKITSLKYRTLE